MNMKKKMVSISVNGKPLTAEMIAGVCKDIAAQIKADAVKGAKHADALKGKGVVANASNAIVAVGCTAREIANTAVSIVKA
jgi:hypothetical protein